MAPYKMPHSLTSWLGSKHCTNRTVTWLSREHNLAKSKLSSQAKNACILWQPIILSYGNTPSKMIAVLLHGRAIYNSILRGSLATGEIDQWMACKVPHNTREDWSSFPCIETGMALQIAWSSVRSMPAATICLQSKSRRIYRVPNTNHL